MNYCLGWPQNMILLISASWVARIIGMSHKNVYFVPAVMVLACNPVQEAEAGRPWVWGQPGLHNKFKASLCNIVILCLKQNKTNKKCNISCISANIICFEYLFNYSTLEFALVEIVLLLSLSLSLLTFSFTRTYFLLVNTNWTKW
jgi:hypothetical protein